MELLAFILYFALMLGSMTLTSLIVSYSVIIPCIYGIVFLKEPISICFVIGLLLLAISLFLVNKGKSGVLRLPFPKKRGIINH